MASTQAPRPTMEACSAIASNAGRQLGGAVRVAIGRRARRPATRSWSSGCPAVVYRWRRRWPSALGAPCDVIVVRKVGAPVAP